MPPGPPGPWPPGAAPPPGDGPQRLHPASPVLDLVNVARGAAIPLVIVLAGRPAMLPLLATIGLAVLGLRYVAWSRFSYGIEDGALVVERGVLNRERKVLPLDRVQQVDLQRKLRHRALGLAVVRVDTAGGGGSGAEVTLEAVTDAEAERLRHRLGSRAGAPPPAAVPGPAAGPGSAPGVGPAPGGPAPVPDERILVEVPYGHLALAGVTGVRLVAVVAVLGALIGLLGDTAGWFGRDADDAAAAAGRVDLGGSHPVVLAVLLLGVVALWLGAAAGSAILSDGGFRLVRRGDRLHVRRGLLDQREATLALHRVQVVRVGDNPVRRALGLVSVSFQSAGGSGSIEGEDSRMTVPVLDRSDLDRLLAEVVPGAVPLPRLRPAPPAARRRAWVRRVVPAVVVLAALVAWRGPDGLPALVPAAVALLVAAGALGEAAYRGLGWALDGDHLVARRGGLVREAVVVPVAKVQSTRLASTPLQRRVGLATLLVDVAGRGRTPAVVDGRAGDLGPLRHRALHTREARRDELAVRRRTVRAAASTSDGELAPGPTPPPGPPSPPPGGSPPAGPWGSQG